MQQHFRGLTETQKATQFKGKDWAMPLSDALVDIEDRLTFVVQETQDGYGHAVFQARDWVGNDPFALLLGDHVYLSDTEERCARQVIAVYEAMECPVSSVAHVREEIINRLGIVTGHRLGETIPAVYEIDNMVEKPALDYARQHLRTPGLPDGEYLGFFGIHVFPPVIFECLQHLIDHDLRYKGEIQMTSAQEILSKTQRYLVCEVLGERFDMGVPDGLVETQIALALHSPYQKQARALLTR